MIWESVLNAAIFGGIIGAVVGLLSALFVRVTCPHCQKRCRLGMWRRRKVCSHCGGILPKKSDRKKPDSDPPAKLN